MGATPCTIRDFCAGGVFLALEESAPVEVDDSVQIHFSAELDGTPQDFQIQVRVAGNFNGGIGCEFLDPDPEAIRALKIQVDEQPSPTEEAQAISATSPPPDATVIIEAIQKMLAEYLAPQIEALFKKSRGELVHVRARCPQQ